ncbi:SDR family NAD(P)-dependent oxidoreductase, partial [Bacillus cereus group sp. BC306]|uniref:SDR family NAD(P)-dependent oxidoreductase n=1 Tax=Bacillus cereus group sp. BC306 TaxID=3445320 RepID=UPI003F241F3C
MKRAQNKVVVVTGGNSGIGRGIAEKFWHERARVVIFGRDLETLEETNLACKNELLLV